jgi:8-oxo-dGTP pyrophosphatase MutT (NUDIX family)
MNGHKGQAPGFNGEIPEHIKEAAEKATAGSAGTLIVSPEGDQILLGAHTVRDGYFRGECELWGPFAGKVEPDEDIVTTAIRETKEELGLQIRPEQISGRFVIQVVTQSTNSPLVVGKGVIFPVVADFDPTNFTPNREISRVAWFDWGKYMQELVDWHRPDFMLWGPKYTHQVLDYFWNVAQYNLRSEPGGYRGEDICKSINTVVTTLNYSAGYGDTPWSKLKGQ